MTGVVVRVKCAVEGRGGVEKVNAGDRVKLLFCF
jgi:hypothetical protein